MAEYSIAGVCTLPSLSSSLSRRGLELAPSLLKRLMPDSEAFTMESIWNIHLPLTSQAEEAQAGGSMLKQDSWKSL